MKDSGQSAFPDIILLHGWSAHGRYFEAVQEQLSKKFHVFTPDLPGHGECAHAEGSLSIRDLAIWLHQYLENNSVHRAVLAGWSMGAMVALEYLKLYGEKNIEGLIIVDMTPRLLNGGDWQLGLKGSYGEEENALTLAAIMSDWSMFSCRAASRFFSRCNQASAMATWVKGEMLTNNKRVMASLWQSMAQQDYRYLLPNIRVPSLIVVGAKSQLYSSETGRYFADKIQDSALITFEKSGHSPHLEEPDKFCYAVNQFVTERLCPEISVDEL